MYEMAMTQLYSYATSQIQYNYQNLLLIIKKKLHKYDYKEKHKYDYKVQRIEEGTRVLGPGLVGYGSFESYIFRSNKITRICRGLVLF